MRVLYIRDANGNFVPVPSICGKDGTSITHSWEGTVLTITSASGTSSVDLKGVAGDPGATGETGANGVSPTIEVTAIDGGNRLTITDANGTQTVDVMHGDVAEVVVGDTVTEDGTDPISGAAVYAFVTEQIMGGTW